MKIYGVAILAACYFAGLVLGEMLGGLFGIKGNLGGVGFGMLFFILLTDWMKKKNKMTEDYAAGISFWTSLYIPIVIAMASIQNVNAAVNSGAVAIVSGIVATFLSFVSIRFLISLLKEERGV
ncbi:malonate transporter subunit MadL [Bacteroidota bacterium]|nr:malonate transporter subunit MadL [Bacteroidota bacterium]